jgi:aminomethyltransferase
MGMLYIVVNGAVKEQDWAIFERELAMKPCLQKADDRILMALQGPKACERARRTLSPEAKS